ncbi:hypothetical protein AHAS_Ahas12G0064400 [Arachis hypogaea]
MSPPSLSFHIAPSSPAHPHCLRVSLCPPSPFGSLGFSPSRASRASLCHGLVVHPCLSIVILLLSSLPRQRSMQSKILSSLDNGFMDKMEHIVRLRVSNRHKSKEGSKRVESTQQLDLKLESEAGAVDGNHWHQRLITGHGSRPLSDREAVGAADHDGEGVLHSTRASDGERREERIMNSFVHGLATHAYRWGNFTYLSPKAKLLFKLEIIFHSIKVFELTN